MLFSVIYSADCPDDVDIKDYAPPQNGDTWDETEGDESYQYGYLEGHWEEGRHRKWCGMLTREQFDEFVSKCGLYAEAAETLGSIGAPGLGYGAAPAISFTSDDPDAILSAYVTPLPEVKKAGGSERNWKRVKKAVVSHYR